MRIRFFLSIGLRAIRVGIRSGKRLRADGRVGARAARRERYLGTRVLTYPLTIGKTKRTKARRGFGICVECVRFGLQDVPGGLRTLSSFRHTIHSERVRKMYVSADN
jgi:hypothetical protein